jgi:DNA-binding HxlR family transcriptional regulator
MRKENSTNTINKQHIDQGCGMAYALTTIGGRWKPAILWRLTLQGKMRYSELRQAIPAVTERILVLQLRELEKDKLVQRTVHPGVPPRVEYELTEKGVLLHPILQSLSDWGDQNREG